MENNDLEILREGYMDYLRETRGLSDRTQKGYLYFFNKFSHTEISQDIIDRFIAKNKNDSICRGFLLSYLKFTGLNTTYIMPEVKTGRRKKRIKNLVSEEELEIMKDYAYKKKFMWGILFDLLFQGGMRRSEPLTVRLNSFDWATWFKDPNKMCRLKIMGKGKKERVVLIDSETTAKLLKRISEVKKIDDFHALRRKVLIRTTPLFPAYYERKVWAIIRKISIKSIGRYVRTHELRYTRATQLLKKGISVRDIQIFLGHSSSQVTEKYLITSEEETLENIEKSL